MNAESFLNGKLQGVRLALRWLCGRIGSDVHTEAEPAHFSKALTLQHSSRAPESSLCHQIKFGNFSKEVLKETVN